MGGNTMAGDKEMQHTDMKPHVQTYDGVIGLLKWGTIASLAVAALVVWMIA
jgi:hypothetical protein